MGEWYRDGLVSASRIIIVCGACVKRRAYYLILLDLMRVHSQHDYLAVHLKKVLCSSSMREVYSLHYMLTGIHYA